MADVWSFAILVIEMLEGKHPFHYIKWVTELSKRMADKALEIPLPSKESYPEELVTLLAQCTASEANNRPNFEHIISTLSNLKYFKSLL